MEFRDIKGYEGLYKIDRAGNIIALKSGRNKISSLSTKGYKVITLFKDGKPKQFLTHRLVAIAFIPNPNNYPDVNHIDSNPGNCHVDNLEWCTPSMNAIHGWNFGNKPKTGWQFVGNGTNNPNSRLDEVQINEIIYEYTVNKVSSPVLAKKYGVCRATIWRHIKQA